jgi:hypothetical protein
MQCIYSSVSRGESPENGSFIEFGRRLSRVSAEKFENGTTGYFQQLEKPAIGGPSGYQRRKFSESRTAWLALQCRSHPSPRDFAAIGEFNWEFCNSEAFGDGFGARNRCAAAKPVTLGKYYFSRPLAFSLDPTLPSTLRVAEVDFDLRCQQEA